MEYANRGRRLGEDLPDLVVRLEGQRIREVIDSLPVSKVLPIRTYDPGAPIFHETDEGATAYLVLDGSVVIEKRGAKGTNRQIARLGEGDVFGEMALLDGPVRSATAKAGLTGCRALEISRTAMATIFSETPKVAQWLLKVLSHRLRVATKMTAEMEQIQDINRRIIDGQEQERRRIARDIHDGPAQQFADYMMRLQIVEKLIERDPEQAKKEAAQLRESIADGLDRLRKVMHNLHGQDAKASGIETAVRKFVARLSQDEGFSVGFDFDARTTSRLPDHLKTTVYCLVQEALNNIRKHADATLVNIRLQPDGSDRCLLEVADDGVGFDVEGLLSQYHSRESLGMTSMKERAELAGGAMSIESKSGKGTSVRFSFPLKA